MYARAQIFGFTIISMITTTQPRLLPQITLELQDSISPKSDLNPRNPDWNSKEKRRWTQELPGTNSGAALDFVPPHRTTMSSRQLRRGSKISGPTLKIRWRRGGNFLFIFRERICAVERTEESSNRWGLRLLYQLQHWLHLSHIFIFWLFIWTWKTNPALFPSATAKWASPNLHSTRL